MPFAPDAINPTSALLLGGALDAGTLVGILGAFFMFGLAVFVHELGHFVFAKLGKVGVKEFAIGMGPKLFSVRRGGTDYSIRALPFGGFVMMEGALPAEFDDEPANASGAGAEEDVAAVDMESRVGEKLSPNSTGDKQTMGESVMEDINALRDKSTLTKVSIFVAGVCFNFLAAIVAMGILYSVGMEKFADKPSKVGGVTEGSPMYEAGLRTLDTVVEFEGKPIKNFDEITLALEKNLSAKKTEPVSLIVERAGEKMNLSIPPIYDPKAEENINKAYDEFQPAYPSVVGGVMPNTPADRAISKPEGHEGLRPGDRILAVNGDPTEYFFQVRDLVLKVPVGAAIDLQVQRKDLADPIHLFPVTVASKDEVPRSQIGFAPGMPADGMLKEPVLTAFANAPLRTFTAAVFITKQTLKTLGNLVVNFRKTKDDVSGPVGIITMAYRKSRAGLADFLDLFIMLNLALMVFNLLPLPILDGGHIAIALFEGITRRRIPPKLLVATFTTMAVALIFLVILITYQDVMKWWLKL